jgi:hypothetical protein
MEEQTQNLQKPVYILKKKVSRLLVPQFFILIGLSLILYGGVLLNLSLLNLRGSTENSVKIFGLIVVALLIILGMLIKFKKAKQNYVFYSDRINHKKESILFVNIASLTKETNFLDKIFGTYDLKLSEEFTIKNLPNKIDIENYVKQMINYNRKQTTQVY